MTSNDRPIPSHPLPAQRILLVEDDEAHAEIVLRAFEDEGAAFQLTVATSLKAACALLAHSTFDLVISDLNLPDGRGIELLPSNPEELHAPFMLMTGQGSQQMAVQALKAGVLDYIIKSDATLTRMPALARQAIAEWAARLARQEAQKQIIQRKDELEALVQERTAELCRANDELENRVAERTAELYQTVVALEREIGERNRMGQLLAWEKNAMERLASAASLAEVLNELMLGLEGQAPGALCSILLLDADGLHLRHGAAPSLPDAYNRLIDGVAIGSCGTATYANRQVIVPDIATDPLWANFRDLALAHGLRSCWSTPIFSSAGKFLGTLAIYYREPRSPTPVELELINRVQHVVGLAIERKLAESKLLLADCVLKNISQGVLITGPDQKIVTVSAAFTAITGYSEREVVGRNYKFLQGTGTDPVTVAAIRQSMEDANDFSGEILNYRKDGTMFWNELTIAPVRDPQGVLTHFIGITRDITERKRAEVKLAQITEMLECTGELAKIGGWSVDLPTMKLTWSRETFRISELETLEEPDLEGAINFYAPEARPVMLAAVQAAIATGTPYDLELPLITAKGNRRWVQSQGFAEMQEGKAVRIYGTFQDITERKRADVALAKAEGSRLAVWQSSLDAIITMDELGNITDFNPAAEKMFGYPAADVVGQSLADKIIPPALREGHRRGMALLLATGQGPIMGRRIEISAMRSDGTEFPVELTVVSVAGAGHPLFLGTIRDITERGKLEDQLRHSQKMQAVGTLAAGIAHDFNNILAAILGNTELALGDTAPEHPARESLDEIKIASARAKGLVQQILAFSSQQPRERHPMALGPLVEEAARLLRATIPAAVQIVTTLETDVPPVFADATQVHQVLVNLCTNAWHALGDQAGRIEVKLRSVTLDAAAASRLVGVGPGRFACVSVSDNGKGMDAATIQRIFDPFFTTKEPGKGTGLGLSVVHGIIKGYQGAIEVDSQPGQGTTFTLYIPATVSAPGVSAPGVSAPGVSASSSRRGEGQRILYLDDDEGVLLAAKRMLEHLGHHVTGFSRAADAVKAFRDNPGQFDLAITDLNVPGTTGLKVAIELLKVRADLPVVLVSGSIDEGLQRAAREAGIRGILGKPFTMAEFSGAIHRLATTIQQL